MSSVFTKAGAAAGALALVVADLDASGSAAAVAGTSNSSGSRDVGMGAGGVTEYEMRVVEGVYVSITHALNVLLSTCPDVAAAELADSEATTLWPSRKALNSLQVGRRRYLWG
jgi:hypothetical protein